MKIPVEPSHRKITHFTNIFKIQMPEIKYTSQKMTKFELQPLPYEYNALEPYIDEETLKVHHDKHHRAYTDKFNAALEAEGIEETDILKIFSNVSSYASAVKNHGGGYWNHQFYWESMTANSKELVKFENISQAINDSFGNFEEFKTEFATSASSLFGSGWTWLGIKKNGTIVIFNTANQENSYMDCMDEDAIPLLVIDVWEHAYYLKYQNRRPEYIENFFKVINWEKVEERLIASSK